MIKVVSFVMQSSFCSNIDSKSSNNTFMLTFVFGMPVSRGKVVVSIEFSPLSTVELTTSWYHLHNGDYQLK